MSRPAGPLADAERARTAGRRGELLRLRCWGSAADAYRRYTDG